MAGTVPSDRNIAQKSSNSKSLGSKATLRNAADLDPNTARKSKGSSESLASKAMLRKDPVRNKASLAVTGSNASRKPSIFAETGQPLVRFEINVAGVTENCEWDGWPDGAWQHIFSHEDMEATGEHLSLNA